MYQQTNGALGIVAHTHTAASTPAPTQTTIYPSTYRSYSVISEEEVNHLAYRYGKPIWHKVNLLADENIYAHRFRRTPDRRAEVVFVIQNPNGAIWVHSKKSYPDRIYRLPTGGIELQESVEDALHREIREETGLPVEVCGFIGLIDYTFHYKGETAQFASYVFHVRNKGGSPQHNGEEAITSFRTILPCQLLEVSADLRNLLGNRHAWGHYRAIAHDVAYETLAV